MKYSNKKGNVKDTYYTLAPINWILKIFALNCVYRENSKLVVHWSLLRNFTILLTLSIVVTFFLYMKVSTFEADTNVTIKFTDFIEMTFILGMIQYIVDLYFIFKTKHVLIKYYKNYDQIDMMLDMTYYTEVRTSITCTFVINIIITLFTIVFDYVAWCVNCGWFKSTLYSVDYFFIGLNMLTIKDLTAHVIQMTYRLKTIENLLKKNYTASWNSLNNVSLHNNFFDSKTVKNHTSLVNVISNDQQNVLVSLKRSYLMLLEQAEYVNSIYGFRMVIFSFSEIIWLVNEINVAIRVLSGVLRPPNTIAYLPGLSSLLRFFNFGTIMYSLIYRCEQTYRKNKNIVNLLDSIIVNGNSSTDLKSSLLELRDLVLFRPVTFHAAEYFTLDNKLLVSICSVVVTYSIILLQNVK